MKSNLAMVQLVRELAVKIKSLEIKIAKLEQQKGKLVDRQQEAISNINNLSVVTTYYSMSMTDAILECLNTSKTPLSISQIHTQLSGGGFQFNTQNPYISIYTMCSKLSKRSVIKELNENGKRMFTKK